MVDDILLKLFQKLFTFYKSTNQEECYKNKLCTLYKVRDVSIYENVADYCLVYFYKCHANSPWNPLLVKIEYTFTYF